jgi:hypothetical protein
MGFQKKDTRAAEPNAWTEWATSKYGLWPQSAKKYWLNLDYLETRTTRKNSACVTSFADPYRA